MKKFILGEVDKIPPIKNNPPEKLKPILSKLYDYCGEGKIVEFSPERAHISALSLRNQLRAGIKSGEYPEGTKITARNRRWYFVKEIIGNIKKK